MSRTPLRVAVVGAGQMGQLHVRVVVESEETELVAVVDLDPEVERLPHLGTARRLDSVDELLAGRPPDLAIVSAPTSQHAALSLRLVEAGVPVLVEKPIADNITDAVRLIETSTHAGIPLAVGHVERLTPP